MPIRYEHVERVATTPERAFAVIDDLSSTAKWLPPCVSLAKVGDGPNAPGGSKVTGVNIAYRLRSIPGRSNALQCQAIQGAPCLL